MTEICYNRGTLETQGFVKTGEKAVYGQTDIDHRGRFLHQWSVLDELLGSDSPASSETPARGYYHRQPWQFYSVVTCIVIALNIILPFHYGVENISLIFMS